MEQKLLDEATMTQFLLGLLSEEERTRIESAFFANDESFEQLAALEHDLVDEYARGVLPPGYRAAFEAKLNTDPRWRQRLLFAQALNRRTGRARQARTEKPAVIAAPAPRSIRERLLDFFGGGRSGMQLVFAGGAAFALILAMFLGWQVRQQKLQLEALNAQRQSLESTLETLQNQVAGFERREEELSRQLGDEQNLRRQLETQRQTGSGPAALRLLTSIILAPGLVRGERDIARAEIPGTPGMLRLQLDLATVGDYPAYRAQLQTVSGNRVWNSNELTAQTTEWGKAVVIDLPSQLLQSGEYELTLEGRIEQGRFDLPAYYYFNVVKR